MRRNLDVEGALPELIGVGAFAPSCFVFCFVISNTTKHGNSTPHIDQEGITIHKTEQEDLHQRRSTKP